MPTIIHTGDQPARHPVECENASAAHARLTSKPNRKPVMSVVASVAATTSIVPCSSPVRAGVRRDSKLIALWSKFEALSKLLDDLYRQEGMHRKPDERDDRLNEIGVSILSISAATFEGLVIKAKVAHWCCGGDFFESGAAELNDVAAFHSLASDLLALQGF